MGRNVQDPAYGQQKSPKPLRLNLLQLLRGGPWQLQQQNFPVEQLQEENFPQKLQQQNFPIEQLQEENFPQKLQQQNFPIEQLQEENFPQKLQQNFPKQIQP